MTTLLIDGDPIAYASACANETSIQWDEGDEPTVSVDTEGALAAVDRAIRDLKRKLGVKNAVLTVSVPTDEGWRRGVLKTYKANRSGVTPPQALGACKEHLMTKWRAYRRPTLEADDVLGILATHPRIVPGEKIIVSIDKDLLQIPGRVYNPRSEKMTKVSKIDADRLHMMQTLTGDTVDGYTGIPGVGPKKAAKIIQDAIDAGAHLSGSLVDCVWPAVRDAYFAAGLNEFQALVQARVARICRASDYDFQTKKVRLWCPPKPKG